MITRIREWFRYMYYIHVLKRGCKGSEWIEFKEPWDADNPPVWGALDLPFPVKDTTKKVVGSFKAEIILEVPEDWDEKQVWFKYNHEGSWCIDNFFDAMKEAAEEHYKKDDGCCFSCGITEFKYERLPNEDDIKHLPVLEI